MKLCSAVRALTAVSRLIVSCGLEARLGVRRGAKGSLLDEDFRRKNGRERRENGRIREVADFVSFHSSFSPLLAVCSGIVLEIEVVVSP
jgi:hypothetical protein